MDLPPSSPFIYIPVILILGITLGFIWGARTTREAYELAQRRADERARKKADRAAERAAAAGTSPVDEANQKPGGST
jgi:hypothetical protein